MDGREEDELAIAAQLHRRRRGPRDGGNQQPTVGLIERLFRSPVGRLTFDTVDDAAGKAGTIISTVVLVGLALGFTDIPVIGLIPSAVSALGFAAFLLLNLMKVQFFYRPWWPYRWLANQRSAHDWRVAAGCSTTEYRQTAIKILRSYRWVEEETRCGRHPEEEDDLLCHLLVRAFLDDLTASYRHTLWRATEKGRAYSPLRLLYFGRKRYPTLIVADKKLGEIGRRFLALLREARKSTRLPDPLVVVVVSDDLAADTAESVIARTDLETAFKQCYRHSDSGIGSRLMVNLRSSADERRPANGLMISEDTTRVLSRRQRAAGTALVGIAAAILVAAPLPAVNAIGGAVDDCWTGVPREHPGIQRIDDDCVGLTDGSFELDPRLATVQAWIADQNAEVVAGGRPYMTVVYVGALSRDDGAHSDALAGVHGELVGLAMQQARHNNNYATSQAPYAGLRLLLANTGPGLRHAAEVAQQITAMAAQDPTILVAVGFGTSRETTRRAIQTLSEAELPMVGSTPTFDNLSELPDGRLSAYFFPVAPANTRMAEQAAYWAREGVTDLTDEAVEAGARPLEPADRAVAFADDSPTELYGLDLASTFMSTFTEHGGTPVVIGSADQDTSDVPGVLTYERDNLTELSRRLEEVCREPVDLVYYAGRSNEFHHFRSTLEDDAGCDGNTVVMAGDDIARWVTDNPEAVASAPHEYPLYYTPLAADGAWSHDGRQPDRAFYADFDTFRQIEPYGWADDDEQPSVAHAAMAWDALLVASSALRDAQDLRSPTEEDEVEEVEEHSLPSTLLVALPCVERVNGVSGLIEYPSGGDTDGDCGQSLFDNTAGNWIPDKMTQLVFADGAVDEGANAVPLPAPTVIAVCGRITASQDGNGPNCL